MIDVGVDPRDLPKREAELFAANDNPQDWAGFVGQVKAKEQLMVAVASAKARDTRLDHVLLASGIRGVGKSTLATLIAAQMDAGLICTTGPLDADKGRRLICSMDDGDVLLIDEVHTLVAGGKSKAEWLLPFMTEGSLYTDEGAIECPDVTIIGATTDAGKLPETIISRFMIKPKITAYSDAEGEQLAGNLARRMCVAAPERTFAPIARAARNNPRDMRSILTAVRDLLLAFGESELDLDKALEWSGFSADGLSQVARDILVVLAVQPKHTASLESLQSLLGEPGPLRHHEQMLLQEGLVTITGRGRTLTEAGLTRALAEGAL
ncbi:MAG: AAA family ATPase [Sciscionella sp.]